MKTKEYTVYKFDELTDEGKEKAIQNYYDINVDYEWWECTCEDAERVGLKITSFDLDRNRGATGRPIMGMVDMIDAILSEHGPGCGTYSVAVKYLSRYQKESSRWYKIAREDDPEYFNEQVCFDYTDDYTDMRDDFLRDLLEEYSIILQHEYDYLTSEESIAESLTCNDYDFTEDGVID